MVEAETVLQSFHNIRGINHLETTDFSAVNSCDCLPLPRDPFDLLPLGVRGGETSSGHRAHVTELGIGPRPHPVRRLQAHARPSGPRACPSGLARLPCRWGQPVDARGPFVPARPHGLVVVDLPHGRRIQGQGASPGGLRGSPFRASVECGAGSLGEAPRPSAYPPSSGGVEDEASPLGSCDPPASGGVERVRASRSNPA